MIRHMLACFCLFLFLFALSSIPVYADSTALIARGVAKTLFSAFEIPKTMLEGAGQAFPLGLVAGAIGGAMKTVVGTVSGAVDIARGSAPYAKYAALFFAI